MKELFYESFENLFYEQYKNCWQNHKWNLYFITYHRCYYASGSDLEPTLGKYDAFIIDTDFI